jgi:hypothetical protein
MDKVVTVAVRTSIKKPAEKATKKKTEMTAEEKQKKEITDKQDAIEENTIEDFKKQLEKEGFL